MTTQPNVHGDYTTPTASERSDAELAETVALALRDEDYKAKVWSRGGHIRVYVTVSLSRGRLKDCGYLAVEDGVVTSHATARRAWFASLAERLSA